MQKWLRPRSDTQSPPAPPGDVLSASVLSRSSHHEQHTGLIHAVTWRRLKSPCACVHVTRGRIRSLLISLSFSSAAEICHSWLTLLLCPWTIQDNEGRSVSIPRFYPSERKSALWLTTQQRAAWDGTENDSALTFLYPASLSSISSLLGPSLAVMIQNRTVFADKALKNTHEHTGSPSGGLISGPQKVFAFQDRVICLHKRRMLILLSVGLGSGYVSPKQNSVRRSLEIAGNGLCKIQGNYLTFETQFVASRSWCTQAHFKTALVSECSRFGELHAVLPLQHLTCVTSNWNCLHRCQAGIMMTWVALCLGFHPLSHFSVIPCVGSWLFLSDTVCSSECRL